MSGADWANIVVTAGLGVAGFWLANSLKLRRRVEQESTAVAHRWEAYKGFWKATEPAAPIRADQEPVSEAKRHAIHAALTKWWFEESGGMLLGSPARELYFTAKNNLTCPNDQLKPASVAASVTRREDQETARSELAIRQLSLVRSAMRTDLGIIARPYGRALDDLDRDFLRSAGVRLWERPWWSGSWREWLVERLRVHTL